VPLLQLLRLLLVFLLHLLLCCFTGVLLRQPLVFLVLLLLEFLPFLFLLREYLFLLLLVLLVQLRVACCLEHWVAQPVAGREDGRAGWVEKHCCLDAAPSSLDAERDSPERTHCAWLTSAAIGRAIGRRSIRRPWRFRRHNGAVVQCSGFRSCCDRRFAHVHEARCCGLVRAPAHAEFEPGPAGYVSRAPQPLVEALGAL